jgi:hypothetical protein
LTEVRCNDILSWIAIIYRFSNIVADFFAVSPLNFMQSIRLKKRTAAAKVQEDGTFASTSEIKKLFVGG